jgi:hypothetical protein
MLSFYKKNRKETEQVFGFLVLAIQEKMGQTASQAEAWRNVQVLTGTFKTTVRSWYPATRQVHWDNLMTNMDTMIKLYRVGLFNIPGIDDAAFAIKSISNIKYNTTVFSLPMQAANQQSCVAMITKILDALDSYRLTFGSAGQVIFQPQCVIRVRQALILPLLFATLISTIYRPTLVRIQVMWTQTSCAPQLTLQEYANNTRVLNTSSTAMSNLNIAQFMTQTEAAPSLVGKAEAVQQVLDFCTHVNFVPRVPIEDVHFPIRWINKVREALVLATPTLPLATTQYTLVAQSLSNLQRMIAAEFLRARGITAPVAPLAPSTTDRVTPAMILTAQQHFRNALKYRIYQVLPWKYDWLISRWEYVWNLFDRLAESNAFSLNEPLNRGNLPAYGREYLAYPQPEPNSLEYSVDFTQDMTRIVDLCQVYLTQNTLTAPVSRTVRNVLLPLAYYIEWVNQSRDQNWQSFHVSLRERVAQMWDNSKFTISSRNKIEFTLPAALETEYLRYFATMNTASFISLIRQQVTVLDQSPWQNLSMSSGAFQTNVWVFLLLTLRYCTDPRTIITQSLLDLLFRFAVLFGNPDNMLNIVTLFLLGRNALKNGTERYIVSNILENLYDLYEFLDKVKQKTTAQRNTMSEPKSEPAPLWSYPYIWC